MKPTIICVMGCIFNQEGKVLLALRNDPLNPQFHNKWQMPGGAVEDGETLEEAVLREMKEETGLQVQLTSKRPAITFGEIDQEGRELGLRILLIGYSCKVIGGKIGEKVSSETKELHWFKLNKINWKETLPGNKTLINQLCSNDLDQESRNRHWLEHISQKYEDTIKELAKR